MSNTDKKKKEAIEAGLRTAWKNPETFQGREMVKGLEVLLFNGTQPHAVDLEAAVLGSILQEKDAMATVGFLMPECFYKDSHAIIFDACMQMSDANHPIDILTMTEKLKKMRKWKISGKRQEYFKTIEKTDGHKNALDAVGGAYYLSELTGRVGSSANLEYHARIVYQKYLLRDGIRKSYQFLAKAYHEEGDVFELRNDLAETLLVNSPTSYFRVRSMDEVLDDAAQQPEMSRLCGELLHKGSITILFAPPGVGKSIGAVQLGNSLAAATSMFPGILVNELGKEIMEKPQELSVLFLDMELFDKEVEKRYTNADHSVRYKFSPNFFRVDPNPEFLDYPDDDFDKFINRQVETIIRQRRPEVLIVDNLTALSSESASDVNVAIKIMRFLKRLRIKYELTILVLGHTTKYNNKMEHLQLSAMKGASAIQDFAPTIFGIGENHNEDGTYYLKQLKGRNGVKVYGKENVLKYHIDMQDNMLQWVFDGFTHEDECLKQFMDAGDQDDYIEEAIKLKARNWTLGWREIHKNIGFPQSWTTLRNKCRQYVQGSKQYEFDTAGNIVEAKDIDDGLPPPAPDVKVKPKEMPKGKKIPF